MSFLASERNAVQKSIEINPHTLSVSRPSTATNDRGITYQDYSNVNTVDFENPVRIATNTKKRSKIIENELQYFNDKVYWIIADYETAIKKYDRFTWNSRNWEIQDVESITIEGGQVVNYQAELKEITQGVV